MEEKTSVKSLILEKRSRLTVEGVSSLISFDEQCIEFQTGDTVLTVTGNELNVAHLSLENGEAEVNGTVDAIVFTESKPKKKLFGFGK